MTARAALKQAILRASRLGIVVTDASKFSQTSLVRFCGFEDVEMFLTATVAAVRETGIELRTLNSART